MAALHRERPRELHTDAAVARQRLQSALEGGDRSATVTRRCVRFTEQRVSFAVCRIRGDDVLQLEQRCVRVAQLK